MIDKENLFFNYIVFILNNNIDLSLYFENLIEFYQNKKPYKIVENIFICFKKLYQNEKLINNDYMNNLCLNFGNKK